MLTTALDKLNARAGTKTSCGPSMGGRCCVSVQDQPFDKVAPISGQPVCAVPRSTAGDTEVGHGRAWASDPGRLR
ncbi:MAG: hypothetical protein U1E62_19410 [Alsobacter sp.]